MKRIVIALTAILLSTGAFAQEAAKKPMRYIKVMGHAEQMYEPTYVDVQISLQEKEKVNNNNSVARKEEDLLNALKALGVPADKLRVQRLNTGEAYSMFGSKYYINKTYTLRIDDLKRYESIILGMVEKDFKNLYITEIGMTEREQKMDEVMAKAVANGINKANIIASSAGTKNIRIFSIDETNDAGGGPIPMYNKYAAMSMDATNIPLGKINLQKDLTMVFEITE